MKHSFIVKIISEIDKNRISASKQLMLLLLFIIIIIII